jgi:hypothetical protein
MKNFHLKGIILSLSALAPGRYTIPIFIFQKQRTQSQYDMLYQDAHNLIKISQEILPNNTAHIHNVL